MANVYLCGAEALTLPIAGATDNNALRWAQVSRWLQVELSALFAARYMTALAYDPSVSIAGFMTGIWGAVIPVSPNAISHPNVVVSQVTIANAISTYGANMIMNLSSGISPNATLLSGIAALKSQALSSGVLWRDAGNLDTSFHIPDPPPTLVR